jgi:hypothetical protein
MCLLLSTRRRKRTAMPPPFRSSLWPSGSIRLGLPRVEAAAGQLRARRVDHAARQSGFSRLRRFPARGVGPGRSRTGGSVPRLLPSGCRPRTLLFRSRLRRPDLTSTFFDRVKAQSQRGTEGSNPTPSSGESRANLSCGERSMTKKPPLQAHQLLRSTAAADGTPSRRATASASMGRHSGAIGTASRVRQWNGGGVPHHWGPNRYPLGWGPYGWRAGSAPSHTGGWTQWSACGRFSRSGYSTGTMAPLHLTNFLI